MINQMIKRSGDLTDIMRERVIKNEESDRRIKCGIEKRDRQRGRKRNRGGD